MRRLAVVLLFFCVVAGVWAQPQHQVNLRAGWNAVAFQGYPVTNLSIGPEVVAFASWDGRQYRVSPLTAPALMALGGPRGVWIYATADTSLTYSAEPLQDNGIQLASGWNLASFASAEPVPGSSLNLTSVLPQFQQINPGNTYTQVDMTAGGMVKPGMAYWVWAAADVNLSWSQPQPSPQASPQASPLPLVDPSAPPFPSPGFPSPLPEPSPAEPSATSYVIADLGTVISLSDDGNTVAALKGSVLQHAELASLNLTTDSSANLPGTQGPVSLASTANGSVDALLIDGMLDDSIALHSRSSNASSVESSGLPLSPQAEGLDISSDGRLLAWTEIDNSRHHTVVFKPVGQALVELTARFPGLNPQSNRELLTRGRGALSDDGQFLLYQDMPSQLGQPGPRYVRVNLTTGANVSVFDYGTTTTDVSLSGNARYVLYHQGWPARVFVRDLVAGGADDEVGTGAALAISSDGRFVLFKNESDLWLRDRVGSATVRVGQATTGVMSRNGRWVVFRDAAGTLWRFRTSAE